MIRHNSRHAAFCAIATIVPPAVRVTAIDAGEYRVTLCVFSRGCEIFVAPDPALCFPRSWPKDRGQKKKTWETQRLDSRYIWRIISLASTTKRQNRKLSVATIIGFVVATKRTFHKNRLRVESASPRKDSYGKRSI